MSKIITHEQFVERAMVVHGDKYDYLEKYTTPLTKVKINCRTHGIFLQTPAGHLSGRGCSKCSGNFMDQSYFLTRAKEVHGNKYDYSLVEYVKAIGHVTIICPEHGEFQQRPNAHSRGDGCLYCSRNARKVKVI